MNYEKKNGKYIFEKDGVFFALTPEQCEEMTALLVEIYNAENPVFGCFVEGGPAIEDCVWDVGNIEDCSIACGGVKKYECKYWRAI